MGAPFNEKDAAELTNVSIREVNETWHQARDDAAKEGGWGVPENRHGNDKSSEKSSSSDSSDYSDSSGK
jgi:hypothetical protein